MVRDFSASIRDHNRLGLPFDMINIFVQEMFDFITLITARNTKNYVGPPGTIRP